MASWDNEQLYAVSMLDFRGQNWVILDPVPGTVSAVQRFLNALNRENCEYPCPKSSRQHLDLSRSHSVIDIEEAKPSAMSEKALREAEGSGLRLLVRGDRLEMTTLPLVYTPIS